MKRAHIGHYTISVAGGETIRAFIPDSLPPTPPIDLAADLQRSLDRTLLALGRLDGAATALPDTNLLLYAFVRKEAVLSSQIEGTQSTLDDLLTHELGEAPGVPIDDVQQVSRYVEAMTQGLNRMRSGFPLSNRLLREMHGILLTEGRGADKSPGEFRRSQNWIGDAARQCRLCSTPAARSREVHGRARAVPTRFISSYYQSCIGTPTI